MSLEIDNHSGGNNDDGADFYDSPLQTNLSPLHDTARKLSRSRSRSRTRSNSLKRSRSPRNRRSSSRTRSSGRKRNRRGNDRRNDSKSNGNAGRTSQRDKELDRELGLKYRWEKTVYVSNIPYTTRWGDLKDLFREKVGDILYCEVFEKNGKSLGVGAIEFNTQTDAERAVKIMNKYEMGNRRISVRIDSEGFKTRQAKEQAAEASSSSSRSNNGSSSRSQIDDQRAPSLSTNILGLLGMNAPLARSADTKSADPQAALLNQLAAQLKVDGPVTNRIFVASLDYRVDERKLKEVFRLAGHVRIDQFFKDRDGKSRGIAILEYDTPLEALNAVSMFNNQVLMERQMTVRFDHKPPSEAEQKKAEAAKLPSGLKSIGKGIQLPAPARPAIVDALSLLKQVPALSALTNLGINLNGTAPSLMNNGQSGQLQANSQSMMGFGNGDKLGNQSRNIITKIFVKNIPFSWDERKLKDKFRQAGYIEHVEIKTKDGKSRGCALIQFSTPEQAVKGVELFNGSRFDGRTLEVNLDKMLD